jgi:hypothetical protein
MELAVCSTPGLARMLKAHNDTVDPRHHISEKDAQTFTSEVVAVLQYTLNARLYSQQLSTYTPANVPRFNLRENAVASNTGWVYQLKHQGMLATVQEVLRLTESNFQREERGKIIRFIEQGAEKDIIISGDRDQLIACNIVDLNVVPINLNALMREIPLVNLYNYAYTFDRFIVELLGQPGLYYEEFSADPIKFGRNKGEASSVDKLMAMLMIAPYHQITESSYEFLISRIMRGATGIEGMARPKYLAEEMYNKALFGEIYTSSSMRDTEPSPGHGASRVDGIKEARYSIENLDKLISNSYRIPAGSFHQLLLNLFADATVPRLSANQLEQYVRRNIVPQFNTTATAAGAVAPQDITDLLASALRDRNLYKDDSSRDDRKVLHQPAETSNQLTFVEKDDKGKTRVRTVHVDGVKEVLTMIGKLRFDTRLCRNLFWIANLQRLLRLKLRRDLSWYDSKIVSDHAAVASSITETYDNDMPHDPSMFNYSY